MRGMTISIGRNFGLNLRRMPGSDERMYICVVAWFPRVWNKQLGYKYGSFRFI